MSSGEKDLEVRLERLEAILTQGYGRSWGPIVDPAPFPWPQPPSPIPWPQPFPFPLPQPRPWPWPIPWPGDPAPMDIARLSVSQLETVRHTLAAEKMRLESLEKLVDDRIREMK